MRAGDALLFAALGILVAGLLVARRLLQDSQLLPWAQAAVVLLTYSLLAAWIHAEALRTRRGRPWGLPRHRGLWVPTGNGSRPRTRSTRTPPIPTGRRSPDDDVA